MVKHRYAGSSAMMEAVTMTTPHLQNPMHEYLWSLFLGYGLLGLILSPKLASCFHIMSVPGGCTRT